MIITIKDKLWSTESLNVRTVFNPVTVNNIKNQIAPDSGHPQQVFPNKEFFGDIDYFVQAIFKNKQQSVKF